MPNDSSQLGSNALAAQTQQPQPQPQPQGLATLPATSLQAGSLQQAQLAQPNAPAAIAFPIQAVPSGTHAFDLSPVGTPAADQILQSIGVHPPMYIPGSVVPPGAGHYKKAWHAERIRAFVEVQGKSLNQLPLGAISQYGDEMTNVRTPLSIDPRCCPFDTSIYENLTVSAIH
jgi:hypothetical protein